MSDELLAALVSGVIGLFSGFALTWYGARKRRQAERLNPPPASKEALKQAHQAFERARQADDRLVALLSDS
jgi:hypothetical protein